LEIEISSETPETTSIDAETKREELEGRDKEREKDWYREERSGSAAEAAMATHEKRRKNCMMDGGNWKLEMSVKPSGVSPSARDRDDGTTSKLAGGFGAIVLRGSLLPTVHSFVGCLSSVGWVQPQV